ncbi:MAG: hypothetical protein E6H67_06885 [Betaproteobacteria bacterium]|nr:MAG: hypothetical protein E6H67_06885 [Betaproteobacteria bacterium]
MGPPFALERLRELNGEHLLYQSTKPSPAGERALFLTPLELIDRLAALVPPPRIPPPPLPRCAGANGRSRKISAATPNGRSWPELGLIIDSRSSTHCGLSRM